MAAQFLNLPIDTIGTRFPNKVGELSQEQLGDIWLTGVKERAGPSCTFDDEYKYHWILVKHFVQMPFYVYSYAFGDCLVYALYDVYATKAVPDFEAKYLDMLAAGGTLRHKELLAPFGLDATDPEFWRRGMKTGLMVFLYQRH